MIFISGILYILLAILGFFVEINNYILIAMILIFAISLFKERELLRGVGSIKNNIYNLSYNLDIYSFSSPRKISNYKLQLHK